MDDGTPRTKFPSPVESEIYWTKIKEAAEAALVANQTYADPVQRTRLEWQRSHDVAHYLKTVRDILSDDGDNNG